MAALLANRCLHHPVREAVARCPECGQFFCRECITEHEDRVVCSSCLKRLTAKKETKRRALDLLRERGIASIDLGGVNTHSLPGISRFKLGTGGAVRTLAGTYC